jgi:hypothetical protein
MHSIFAPLNWQGLSAYPRYGQRPNKFGKKCNLSNPLLIKKSFNAPVRFAKSPSGENSFPIRCTPELSLKCHHHQLAPVSEESLFLAACVYALFAASYLLAFAKKHVSLPVKKIVYGQFTKLKICAHPGLEFFKVCHFGFNRTK